MYYYSFDKFYWFDRVVKLNEESFNVFPGDLIKIQNTVFLCLWDNIAFAEQYKYVEEFSTENSNIIYTWFFSEKLLSLLHWMVYYNYTTYKSIIKLFLPTDIMSLVNREILGKSPTRNKKTIYEFENILNQNITSNVCYKNELFDHSPSEKWQILYIFPDLWTLKNMVDDSLLVGKKSIVLHSMNSTKQKDIAWRNIKKNKVQFIFTTPGEVFQDYKNLSKIYFIFPHKRYYTNQQDPRFKMWDIVKILTSLWQCELYNFEW